MTRRNQLKKAV